MFICGYQIKESRTRCRFVLCKTPGDSGPICLDPPSRQRRGFVLHIVTLKLFHAIQGRAQSTVAFKADDIGTGSRTRSWRCCAERTRQGARVFGSDSKPYGLLQGAARRGLCAAGVCLTVSKWRAGQEEKNFSRCKKLSVLCQRVCAPQGTVVRGQGSVDSCQWTGVSFRRRQRASLIDCPLSTDH